MLTHGGSTVPPMGNRDRQEADRCGNTVCRIHWNSLLDREKIARQVEKDGGGKTQRIYPVEHPAVTVN